MMKPHPLPRGRLALLVCLAACGAPAFADNLVADDQVVQGSLCVGIDCVDGEAFGFDTIRLKENNLRIDFEDTSTTAGFPTNDWGIVVNDSPAGGASYFMIEDRGADGTAASSVFRIDAGAGGAVRLGSGAASSGAWTLSVGAAGSERRITHVDEAVSGTDAVNLAQMSAAIAAAGGGVGAAYVDAGDAAVLDAARTYADDGDARVLARATAASAAGDAATFAAATAYAAEGDARTLEHARTDARAGDAATLAQAQAHADTGDARTYAAAAAHADQGDADTYAAATAHADQGDARAYAAATDYADTRVAAVTGSARSYTDARVNGLAGEFSRFQSDVWEHLDSTDRRIDRSGAMNGAMAHMVANAAGGRTERGRVAVGMGTQNGQGALAIGYGRRIGERASMTFGGAVSGSDSSAGLGLGFDL